MTLIIGQTQPNPDSSQLTGVWPFKPTQTQSLNWRFWADPLLISDQAEFKVGIFSPTNKWFEFEMPHLPPLP